MESNNIIEIFFSLENPAIYAILFLLILVILVLLIRKEFISPLTRSKRKLELENVKLAALYSEVDPDPIIRISEDWKVIDKNTAAKKIFKDFDEKLHELILRIRKNNSTKVGYLIEPFDDKYYSVVVKDIPELGFKHIYLADITNRVNYERQIVKYQEHLKQLRIKIDSTNEEEKQRIGKDLHDGIGHSLSLLKIEVQNYIGAKSLNIEDKKAQEVLNSIDVLSNEVRDISHELRPRILNEFGLVQALKSHIEIRNLSKYNLGEVTQNIEFRISDKKLELNIYRICQEAIRNIAKHSRCKEYFLDFYLVDNNLEITISDDGVGFDVDKELHNKGGSLGLFNMKERADAVGGFFEMDSILSLGTTIFMNFKIIRD
jgi:signal transduction histidine kinase